MSKIETIQDFKKFLKDNREKLLESAIKIENLPPDDDWVNDSIWDDIYKNEVTQNGKI